LTLYFGLQTRQGIALNALSRTRGQDGGVWVVDGGQALAEATAASLVTDGACTAAAFLVDELCRMPDPGSGEPRSVHPQLRQAIEFVSSKVPDHVDVASVATAVALSPDYLGRLCKQQTGVSFSATIRWVRLLTSLRYIAAGMPVTDAAHLAGFADGFARQPGVLGNGRGRSAGLRAGASRFTVRRTDGRLVCTAAPAPRLAHAARSCRCRSAGDRQSDGSIQVPPAWLVHA
jgi:AraC-like DNA-binding protein